MVARLYSYQQHIIMKIINRLTSNWFAILCITFCTTAVYSSCGSDDDEITPNEGGIVPGKDMPDPEGTITLSIRDSDNGKTNLDNIIIDNENFTHDYSPNIYFASIGSVKGLGNVTDIPTTGWASKVAVIPGNGYVVCDIYKEKFYRIYVTDYIVGTTGGIIGAEVKYQTPFKGKDEAISLDIQSLTIPAEGGVQTLTFNNQGVILFDVKSDKFTVEKASTYDSPFLTNGIAIKAEPNSSSKSIEGTITLTTLYGKETVIKVTQAGAEPFVSFDERELDLTFNQQTRMVGMSGNIAFSDLSASSSASWCKVELIDNSDYMQTKSNSVKFIGGQPIKTTKAAQSDAATSYSLTLSLDENATTTPRNATITVKSKDGKASATLKVVQKVGNVSFRQEQIELSAKSQIKEVYFTSDLDISNLRVKSSTSWCKVDFGTYKNSIQIECDENPSKDSRNAIIALQSATGEDFAQLEVMQVGATFEVSNSKIGFDKSANYRTINISTPVSNWEAESSASWCTFSKNGNQITIRVTAAEEDRTAVVSFKDFDAKITVHQSKYAVGENYNENGIEGTVGYIGDEERFIYKELENAAWSTENVRTGADNKDDGEYNMNVIKKIPNWEDFYPAFYLCEQLNTNGVSGWYLPAINEVEVIPRDFSSCWSSTEYNYYRTYGRYSNSSTNNKGVDCLVIAIHKF